MKATYGKLGLIVLMVTLLAVTTGPAVGNGPVITNTKAVGGFVAAGGHVENMTTLPDTTTGPDWTSSGTMTLGAGFANYSTPLISSAYYNSGVSPNIWGATPNVDSTNGFTVETRVRINSIAAGAGSGAFQLYTGASPSNKQYGQVHLYADGTVVNGGFSNGGVPTCTQYAYGQSNMGDWHTFRIACQPSVAGAAMYSLYRDGVLLSENNKSTYYNSTTFERCLFGDGSGAIGGDVDIDYVGFTPGAYAPVGFTDGRAKAENLACCKYSSGFDWKYDGDVLPSDADLDGPGDEYDFALNCTVADPVASGGIITIDTSADGNCYFEGNGTGYLWGAQDYGPDEDGYTLEFRVKVTDTDNPNQGMFSVSISQPSHTTAQALFLRVAENKTIWYDESTRGTTSPIDADTNANNDGFHTFRLVCNPWEDNGRYFLYRDEELIGDYYRGRHDVLPERIYFGDPSGDNDGVIELDYFRFTEGACQIPEPTTLMLLVCGALMVLVRRRTR